MIKILKVCLFKSKHVRVLGVTISSDLSLVKHVSNVCAAGFFQDSTTSSRPTIT